MRELAATVVPRKRNTRGESRPVAHAGRPPTSTACRAIVPQGMWLRSDAAMTTRVGEARPLEPLSRVGCYDPHRIERLEGKDHPSMTGGFATPKSHANKKRHLLARQKRIARRRRRVRKERK